LGKRRQLVAAVTELLEDAAADQRAQQSAQRIRIAFDAPRQLVQPKGLLGERIGDAQVGGDGADPGGFREVLETAASYGKPVWITENGIADANDSKRPSYIVNHIAVVQDLVAHGMDIRGYTYWSLVDNLEWANGYGLQFGLYGSDPTTPDLERTPKPASISAISQITTNNALPTSLLALYLPGVV